METDPEMLDAFAEEILAIKAELDPIMLSMKAPEHNPALFEKFGQVIDRIYGTAATMGFMEVAAYCRTMKSISYKCSQSENSYAIGKVKVMCQNAYGLLEKFSKIIKNPTEVKKIQYSMQKDREAADALEKNLFSNIVRASSKT